MDATLTPSQAQLRAADRLADYRADDGPCDRHIVVEQYVEDVSGLLAQLAAVERVEQEMATELQALEAAYALAKEQSHTSYQQAWETMASAWEKGGSGA